MVGVMVGVGVAEGIGVGVMVGAMVVTGRGASVGEGEAAGSAGVQDMTRRKKEVRSNKFRRNMRTSL
jgi:hypothetical protein